MSMADVSLDVKHLVEQAFEIARSGGEKDPAAWRAQLAEVWKATSEAHFERLAASCKPPVIVKPGLKKEFLKHLAAPTQVETA